MNGGADLTFGPTIDVAMRGVSPVGPASGAPAPVGTVRMAFSRNAALRGRLELAALDLSSVRVIIDAAEPSAEALGRSIAKATQEALSSPLVRSLNLKSPSLGDVQELFELKRVLEGAGTLSLVFDDIRSVQGDPNDPILDLTGHRDDVLALRDLSLEGDFRLRMAGRLTGRADATSVGTLKGGVALSDASGHLRLDKLDADLTETDLMALSLRLEQGGESGDRIDLKLEVPELAALASALGRRASGGIRIAFDGTLGAADGTATLRGSARPTWKAVCGSAPPKASPGSAGVSARKTPTSMISPPPPRWLTCSRTGRSRRSGCAKACGTKRRCPWIRRRMRSRAAVKRPAA